MYQIKNLLGNDDIQKVDQKEGKIYDVIKNGEKLYFN